MSDTRETNEDKGNKAAPQKPSGTMHLIVLVVAMVITVLGAIGGVVFWLAKTGRLPQAAASQVQTAAKPDSPKTRLLPLEPLLVNLSDAGGNGYLRLVVVLRIEDPAPAKGTKPKDEKPAEKGKPTVNEDEVRMRDAALGVIGRETSERLLAAEGKERLKGELRDAFSTHVPEVKVTDILYTEFLVQR
jgi:flagellar protein FliL